eukprot:4052830-Pleurochrysis_carterae.AAC.1
MSCSQLATFVIIAYSRSRCRTSCIDSRTNLPSFRSHYAKSVVPSCMPTRDHARKTQDCTQPNGRCTACRNIRSELSMPFEVILDA